MLKQTVISLFFILITTQSLAYDSYVDAKNAATKDETKRLFCVFTSKSCVPCQTLKDTILSQKDINNALHNSAVVYYVDIDEETEVADAYLKAKIWDGQVPMCIVFNRDATKIINILSGLPTRQEFIKWWNGALTQDPPPKPIPAKLHPIYIRYAQWLKSELTEEEMILFIKELQHVDK